ncbi:hypothetical protein BH10PSE12_BH10PSE12_05420 [soil metagenome]
MSIQNEMDETAATNRGNRPAPGVGEVKGSGAGAGGGGNPEDYDDDSAGGGGAVETGATGATKDSTPQP